MLLAKLQRFRSPLNSVRLNRANTITDGIVGAWVGSMRGPNIQDVSGNNRPMQLKNSATWAMSHDGSNALSLVAASNQYAELTATTLQVEPITMAVWFNQTAATSQILMALDDPATTNQRLEITCRNTSILRTTKRDGSNVGNADTTATFALGTWNLAVATFASTTLRSAFLNGRNKVSGTDSITAITPTICCLGANRFLAGVNGPFGGMIASGVLWNRVLSDNEIWSLYDPSTRFRMWEKPSTTKWFVNSTAAPPSTGQPILRGGILNSPIIGGVGK